MKYIHKDKPVDLMKYAFLNQKLNSLKKLPKYQFPKIWINNPLDDQNKNH